MKLQPWLLVGSLLANAVFGGWWFTRTARPQHEAATAASLEKTVTVASAESGGLSGTPSTTATWAAIATGTPSEYVARLKREGFTPGQIKALLTARVRAAFAARLEALQGTNRGGYWRRSMGNREGDLGPEKRAERRQLNREIESAVREAMGAEYAVAVPMENILSRRYGPLSAAKLERVRTIESDYAELNTQVHDRAQGVIMPEDREQLRLLERERRADLAALLTPAELLEYDLRSSDSASTVRRQLRYVPVSEQEYRDLVALRLDFDALHAGANAGQATARPTPAAEAEYLAQVRGVLSADRFADYELRSSDEFRRTMSALAPLGVDQSVAADVVRLQRDVVARAAAVAANPVFGPQERAAQLTALQREASAKLSTTLGTKEYEAYVRQGAGGWVKKISAGILAKP